MIKQFFISSNQNWNKHNRKSSVLLLWIRSNLHTKFHENWLITFLIILLINRWSLVEITNIKIKREINAFIQTKLCGDLWPFRADLWWWTRSLGCCRFFPSSSHLQSVRWRFGWFYKTPVSNYRCDCHCWQSNHSTIARRPWRHYHEGSNRKRQSVEVWAL